MADELPGGTGKIRGRPVEERPGDGGAQSPGQQFAENPQGPPQGPHGGRPAAALAAQSPQPAPGPIVIEIADPLNRQVLFGPEQERLRGRWDSHNLMLGDTSSAGLMQMPVIPGLYVALDVRERRGSITDPLASPEFAGVLAQVSGYHRELWKQPLAPRPSLVREEMNDDDVATWLYWMMRVVVAGSARVLVGSVPANEKAVRRLVPKGHITKDFYNSMIRRGEENEE